MAVDFWQYSFCYALLPHRYYDLELPVSLKNSYFFDASQFQGHEHANASKVLPHLLQGELRCVMDFAMAWRAHQMLAVGMFHALF